MPKVSDLMEVGFNPIQAKHLGAQSELGDFNNLSALGNNSQADAYQIIANYNIFTTVGASTNSAKLPKAESDPHGVYYILNLGANALNLFPFLGDSFNNLAANTAISIPVNYAVTLVKQTNTSWQVQKTIGSATSSGTNTGDVTLAGTPDYITISGQTITRGQVDLTTDVTGVLPIANGGTNKSSYSQGDILYASAGTTLTTLAKNTAATRYLSNTGTSNNPAWDFVDVSNGVTGILPIANGGTGISTGAWVPWTPSYSCSGSMTISSVTTDYVKYRKIGNTIWFSLAVTAATLGGTASNTIIVNLPETAAAAFFEFSCFTFDGASDVGRAFTGTNTECWLRLRAGGNWTLGASKQFRVTGTYEVA